MQIVAGLRRRFAARDRGVRALVERAVADDQRGREARRGRSIASSSLRPPLGFESLAFENKIAHFAHCALSAGGLGDEVGLRFHAWMRVGDCDRKPRDFEHGQVRRIIAHTRDRLRAEPEMSRSSRSAASLSVTP